MASKTVYLSKLSGMNLPEVEKWISSALIKTGESGVKGFILNFSLLSRKFSKHQLQISDNELLQLQQEFPFFHPWNTVNFTRIYFLLKAGNEFPEVFLKGTDQLFSMAALEEQSFLLRVLPYFPFPEQFLHRAGEGIRSNSTAVFDAIALDNPYPELFLPDHSWNQMVLKAVFTGRPLYRIVGLDMRMNKDLAVMLKDLVKERTAAGRKITPEAWRLLGAYLEEDVQVELKTLCANGDQFEKMAALLAVSSGEGSFAKSVVDENKAIIKELNANKLTWDRLGKMYADKIERNN